MSEVFISVLVFTTPEHSDSLELCLPLPVKYIFNSNIFEQTIAHTSKIRRYFVLLFEPLNENASNLYDKMETNSDIISIFIIWNKSSIPRSEHKKLYYIPKKLIDLVIGLSYIHQLKFEAEKTLKNEEISLATVYLRKADKTKEWLMSNLRAEPCHVLIIPLNTDIRNLNNATERIQQICIKLGYPDVIVRTLDEYIPKNEIYNKLPYGNLIFQYEEPETICRWLRTLGSIRLYLYGNRTIIQNEWSKQMIINEPDSTLKHVINDEDLCLFLENESIEDSIKWNFFVQHAQSWQIRSLTPFKIETFNDNIRFRSALRRAHLNFTHRMHTITAQTYDWYDQCLQHGYLSNEFKLVHQEPTSEKKISDEQPNKTRSIIVHEKGACSYTICYTPRQDMNMSTYRSYRSEKIFIWLDTDLKHIEQRFKSVISSSQWRYFSNVDQCQKYILSEQIQSKLKIYLVSSYILGEQLFVYEHTAKVYAVYLYSNRYHTNNRWIRNFSNIRGIYHDLNRLFEQFETDITTNIDLSMISNPLIEIEDEIFSPFSFLDTDQDNFRRNRAIIDILLKSPRTSNDKQTMVNELRHIHSSNERFLKHIDDFERDYHSNDAIQWYTKESCFFRLIHQALHSQNIDLIMKYQFFICDLYQKLDELHQQMILDKQTKLTVYRGQALSKNEIDKFTQHIGGLISSNSFLSTTESLDIAMLFTGSCYDQEMVLNSPVIFCIEIDSSIRQTRPYARLNYFSSMQEEDEVLFAVGSVFRIEKITNLSDSDHIQVINLQMIDENDLPKESTPIDITKLIPEQKLLNPHYVIVGLTSSYQENPRYEQIKSKLDDIGILFFENTDDLDDYTKSIKTIQSFVIFIHTSLFIPERYQQSKIISFAEIDMHFNDLIYSLLYEMEYQNREKQFMKDLYTTIGSIYSPSNKQELFYVQLIHSLSIEREDENELRNELPSSAVLVTFYQVEPCINFLQSRIESENTLGNIRLIIESNEKNLENVISQFEPVQSIKFIYIYSKYTTNISSRRIIHGIYSTKDELYLQLNTDHLYQSFRQANQQIEIYKNQTEAKKFFQQTDFFYNNLKKHKIIRD